MKRNIKRIVIYLMIALIIAINPFIGIANSNTMGTVDTEEKIVEEVNNDAVVSNVSNTKKQSKGILSTDREINDLGSTLFIVFVFVYFYQLRRINKNIKKRLYV